MERYRHGDGRAESREDGGDVRHALETKECRETKVRDEGTRGSLRRRILKTEIKESGSSKENDI
jgi:hypothetical protein